MRVLALDTCSPRPSVALAAGAVEVVPLAPGAGETLAEAARTLLSRAGIAPSDLGCVAALTGPGSFTGLRAGLAFARGLARAVGIPLVGLSTFAAAAAARPEPADADFVLEAGRGDVYRARRRSGVLVEEPAPVPRPKATAEAADQGVPLLDLAVPGPPLSAALAAAAALGEAGSGLPSALRYGRPSAAEERFGVPEGNLPGTGLA